MINIFSKNTLLYPKCLFCVFVTKYVVEVRLKWIIHMGESFQDYSWMQDFEADFPKSVSLKMLNSAGNYSFSDLVSVYLKVFDH